MSIRLLLTSLVVVLAGCASTTPTALADAKQAPAQYLYKNQVRMSESDARILVIRDQGLIGAACRLGFFIDGQRVADLDSKETASFYVPAGTRLLGAGVAAEAKGLCGSGGDSRLRQREAMFAPGQERTFRLSISANGDLDVLPVAP